MASEIKEESNSTSSDVKSEDRVDETKKIDTQEKDGDKDSVKSETKDESGKEASEDDEESDDEEVALLDRPVEVTGCRARKKVERLEVSFTTPKEKQEFPEGKGKKLGECPRIEIQIQKMKPIELKPLHKILFNRTGSANEIKKNIRKYSGFPFEKDSPEFTRKKASVEKLTASVLKQVCLILDIERGGTKEDIVNRIMLFLLNPEDSGKKVPAPKRKISKEKKKSNKKVKSDKKKSAKDETSVLIFGDNDDDEDDDDDEEEEDEAENSIEEEDDSTCGEASMGGTDEEAEGLVSSDPKKKSKKSKSKTEKSKKDEKKKKEKRKHDNEKSSGDSDDEPIAKKSKMPSDEEISKLVKKILESANLQEITMKKVIKQVSDTYPDQDLSHKKAFIKSTIKSIL